MVPRSPVRARKYAKIKRRVAGRRTLPSSCSSESSFLLFPFSLQSYLNQGLCLSNFEQTQSLSVRDYGTNSSAGGRLVSVSQKRATFLIPLSSITIPPGSPNLGRCLGSELH